MEKIIITHPGLQHSHQSAQALFEAGMLQQYFSGVPVKNENDEYSFLPKKVKNQIKQVNVPRSYRSHPVLWQVYLRVVRKFYSGGEDADFVHKVFHRYDKWFSSKLHLYKPDAVIGYENSCAETFKVAKKLGIKCILDAPSMHYKFADKMVPYETAGYRDYINHLKQKEIELADAIITCSSFAASSYIENGVPEAKTYPTLLGSELPNNMKLGHKNINEFAFAGAMTERKSIDLILKVFKRLHSEGSELSLKIIGGSAATKWIDECVSLPNVSYLGRLPQKDLYAELAKSGCLLLPSRFDSFGMVVAEANAAGTPAIVSEYVGAKEMIQLFPDSGWIIKPTEDDIYKMVKLVGGDNVRLSHASLAAKDAANNFSWHAYRLRFASTIKEILTN